MQWINNVIDTISAVIRGLRFSVFDLIDVALMSYILYKAGKILRETRAYQLIKGILLLSLTFAAAKLLRLQTLDFLFTHLFQIGVLLLIVLFQPELRRVLERVGRSKVSTVFGTEFLDKHAGEWEPVIPVLVEAIQLLSKTETGALIVIEQQTKLGEQISTGVEIGAKLSVELIRNIFFLNSPLHDGAVIMRDGRIHSAACFLPKPQNEDWIATHLGSRHRAAIGVSEISDAITIIVSEQTGTVSIAENGQLHRGYTSERLTEFLSKRLLTAPEKNTKKLSFPKGKQHL